MGDVLTEVMDEDTLGIDRIRAFILQHREKRLVDDVSTAVSNLQKDPAGPKVEEKKTELSALEQAFAKIQDKAKIELPKTIDQKVAKREEQTEAVKDADDTDSNFMGFGKFDNRYRIASYAPRDMVAHAEGLRILFKAYSYKAVEAYDTSDSAQQSNVPDKEKLGTVDREILADIMKNDLYDKAGISHMSKRNISPEARERFAAYKLLHAASVAVDQFYLYATMHRG